LLLPLDPILTLTRMQYPATVSNAGKRKPLPMRNLQTRATLSTH
jgi:hypothetical protein